MFAAVKPIVAGADLAVCHSEVPFAPPGGPYTGYPLFAAPPAIAGWIASMGWDVCTTASNHALDQGFQGLVRTKDLYDQAGVRTVGTFRSEAERATPVIVTTAQGVRIAVVTGTYSLNGIPLPSGRPWAVSLLDTADLLAQAKRAKEAGADIVLAEIHGGDEYVVRPSRQQVDLATALTASPYVDLVFGEHTHVVQPITRVNGQWVVYGLGIMIGQHLTEVVRAYEGITARVTFTERPAALYAKAEYLPTYWNHNPPDRCASCWSRRRSPHRRPGPLPAGADATRRAGRQGVTPGWWSRRPASRSSHPSHRARAWDRAPGCRRRPAPVAGAGPTPPTTRSAPG
jgi:poly-gamma-glutamate synthesis protein (capsule biosynthesis protein)